MKPSRAVLSVALFLAGWLPAVLLAAQPLPAEPPVAVPRSMPAVASLSFDDRAALQDELEAAHEALFDTFFPIDELPLSEALKAVAREVRKRSWSHFETDPYLSEMIEGAAYPEKALEELPPEVRDYFLELSRHDPIVYKFISEGYVALMPTERYHVLKILLESPFNAMRRVAAALRTAYSTAVYGSPVGLAIAGVAPDRIYVPDMPAWVEQYAPRLPDPGPLAYDADARSVRRRDGKPIDYVIVGSGPAGAVMAYRLRAARKTVVLIDQGPFVVLGSTRTLGLGRLMYDNSALTTADGGVFIRAGRALGGGSTVNIDLAFSPLEATAQGRIRRWSDRFLVDPKYYTIEKLSDAYRWVRKKIDTIALEEDEINGNNRKLWDGARAFGVDPSLYYLNRYQFKDPPLPKPVVSNKKDAVRMLLQEAMEAESNPLSVISDAEVVEVLFDRSENGAPGDVRARGIRFKMLEPWSEKGNTVIDPSRLGIATGTEVTLEASNVVLAAGSIGTSEILLRSRDSEPALRNPLIGKGAVLHPAMPIIGLFCDLETDADDCDEADRVGVLDGLRDSVHVDAFGLEPGFILEAMAAFPSYAAVMVPGRPEQVYDFVDRYNWLAGFGVLLIDTPSENNQIVLDPNTGRAKIEYALSESDLKRMRKGVGIAVRMMFLAGARQVMIPSNENFLGQEDFDPTVGVYLDHIDQAERVERDLNFIPNRTIITSAHMQASNKMAPSIEAGVVSWKQRVWNYNNGREIPNLYVMDSSIFPTSVGANPMQSIYTFAKIFSDRLIEGID